MGIIWEISLIYSPMRTRNYYKKNINIFTVNIFCLIFGILFLTIGNTIQEKNFFIGTFITEVFLLLIPAIIILFFSGNVKRLLSVKKISFINIVLVIFVTILSYPIILLLNGLFLNAISKVVEFNNFSQDIFTKSSFSIYLVFACLIPSICEEVFFRGMILNAYDIYGRKFAILLSSFIFAMSHFDIQNFVAPFLLGILFANLMELTGSIYAPIISHFTNNIIAILVAKFFNDNFIGIFSNSNLAKSIGSTEAFTVVVLTVLSVISVVLLVIIFKYMSKKRTIRQNSEVLKTPRRSIDDFEWFSFIPVFAEFILYIIYNLSIFRR